MNGNKLLHNITSGGNALQQYDEYKKVEVIDGVYRITSRRVAMRHRLHIGTIVSEPMMKVQLLTWRIYWCDRRMVYQPA